MKIATMFPVMKSLHCLCLLMILAVAGCKTYKERPDLVDIRKYTPAAEHGDALAQYRLGQAYASHWQFPQANLWYQKSALQGNPNAMYSLGVNYLNGAGMPKNPIEALAWFHIATSQNQILARNAREYTIARMTHAETDQGIRRASAIVAEIPPEKLIYAYFKDDKNIAKQSEPNKATPTVEKKAAPAPAPIKSTTPAPAAKKSMRYGSADTKGGTVQISD